MPLVSLDNRLCSCRLHPRARWLGFLWPLSAFANPGILRVDGRESACGPLCLAAGAKCSRDSRIRSGKVFKNSFYVLKNDWKKIIAKPHGSSSRFPSFLPRPFLSSVFDIGSPLSTTHVLEWDCTQAEPLSLLLSHQTRVCYRFEDLRGTWWCFFRKYGFETPLHFLWLQEEWLLLSRLIMLRLGPFPSWIQLLRSGLSQGSSFTRIYLDKWKFGSRQLLMVWKRSRLPLSTALFLCVFMINYQII